MVSALLVQRGAHVLAAIWMVPILRRVVCFVPEGAARQRQHRRVAVGMLRDAKAHIRDDRGHRRASGGVWPKEAGRACGKQTENNVLGEERSLKAGWQFMK